MGCQIDLITLPIDTNQSDLADRIIELNEDDNYHGIMIQKPLPRHIDDTEINSLVSPNKDIDSLNPVNLGKIILEADGFLPCTPFAVWLMMQYYGIDPQGKSWSSWKKRSRRKASGKHLLWKKPFANAQSRSATERPKTLSFSSGSRYCDLGNRSTPLRKTGYDQGWRNFDRRRYKRSFGWSRWHKYVGDIDFNGCIDKALAVTPVPGGVGTVTTAVLMANLVKAALGHKYPNKRLTVFSTSFLMRNR